MDVRGAGTRSHRPAGRRRARVSHRRPRRPPGPVGSRPSCVARPASWARWSRRWGGRPGGRRTHPRTAGGTARRAARALPLSRLLRAGRGALRRLAAHAARVPDANPREVVILVLEDYVAPPEIAARSRTAASPTWCIRGRHPPWPTLEEMAASRPAGGDVPRIGRAGRRLAAPRVRTIQETPYRFHQPVAVLVRAEPRRPGARCSRSTTGSRPRRRPGRRTPPPSTPTTSCSGAPSSASGSAPTSPISLRSIFTAPATCCGSSKNSTVSTCPKAGKARKFPA